MSDGQLLEAMIGAAIDAGRAIDDIYRSGFEIAQKADSSPVTTADHAAERIIVERLSRCAASTPVVAEEAVAAGCLPAAASEFFLVDPLDGTKEFIGRRGDFTVNIALVRAGTPTLGVVYAPAKGRLFAGDATLRAAFALNREPTESEPEMRDPIRVRVAPSNGLTAVASRSHRTPETDAYLARYPVAELVSVGSSLKFCLLAEGKADLYPRMGPTMEWDTAAGHAVLLAAGGAVIGPDGMPLRYGKPEYRNPWFVASGSIAPLPFAA
jgi:3'(2'), 5'-bisphosphate nucleotidase